MKKTIAIALFAFVFVLIGGKSASAATLCGDPANSTPTTTYVRCDTGNPENVVAVWGTNSDVPRVSAGAKVTDEGGFVYTCPLFITTCVDLTHTTYYRNSMLELGRQLKVLGYSGGPFGYWISLAH